MFRSRLAEAALIGCLTALASFCAFNAQGGETYSIVAQSSRSTAATGRRPLAERIAAANLPIISQAASSPATIQPRQAARPESSITAEQAGNGENMAVAAVRVDQPEAAAPPPRPTVTPPVLWPFGTKRAAPPAPTVAKGRATPSTGSEKKAPGRDAQRDAQRQADARSSGKGLSSSRPASVTR